MKKPAPGRRKTKKKTTRPPAKKRKQTPEHRWPRSAPFVLMLLMGLGCFGWWWKMQLVYQGIEVTGTHYSDSDTLLNRIDVDSSTLFFDVTPQAISQRVTEDSWVESAHVRRLPNASFSVSVTERIPALLL